MSRDVVVVPHDPDWSVAFSVEAAEVAAALGPNHVASHHMGSTAIPGIHAKPVIDIAIEVSVIEAVDSQDAAMEAIGYEAMGEFGLAGRRYFRKNDALGVRSHQVHVYAAGSHGIVRYLAFRDFMRTHPTYARHYSDLKRGLAQAHPEDIGAYTAGKDAFIKDMECRALAWQRDRGADG